MFFAIVRNGVIVDFARHETFGELGAWMPEPRRGTDVVILDLGPGESPSVGARVAVTEVVFGVGRLAG